MNDVPMGLTPEEQAQWEQDNAMPLNIPNYYKRQLGDDVDVFVKLPLNTMQFNLDWIEKYQDYAPIAVGIVLGDLQLLLQDLIDKTTAK